MTRSDSTVNGKLIRTTVLFSRSDDYEDAATPNHDDDADDDTGDDRAGYFGIKWVKLFLFHESFNGLHTSGPSLTEGPRSFVALVHS